MSVFDRIKSEVQISSLLDALWIKYNSKKWIWDVSENKYTDSWHFTETRYNMVTNENKWKIHRAEWNPFEFYIKHTWQSEKEALDFFQRHFNIRQDDPINNTYTPTTREEVKKTIIDLEKISDTKILKEYLEWRWINLDRLPLWLVNLVKWTVYWKDAPKWEQFCLEAKMHNVKWELTWTQLRNITWWWKWFFTNWNDSMFYHFWKWFNSDYIILVEWLTDFLSIRQFDQQVIWMKSSKTPPSVELIAFLNKFKKIYLLFDNDEAWKTAKEKFKEQIDSNIYEIEEEEDINELTIQVWEWIIDAIKWSAYSTKEKTFQHIDYIEWLDLWYKELRQRTKASVISYWFEKFDELLWYILPWQLIVIWWTTWVWKSTIVNQIANNVARQWFKVARYSLEDRLEENRINELYYQLVSIRKDNWDSYPNHSEFEANLFTEEKYHWILVDLEKAYRNLWNFNKWIIDLAHKKMVWIQELENLFKDVVINQWVKLFIIDHLHYVKFEKNQRHDLAIEEFMHQLNDLLRRYKVSCILVSHYRKGTKDRDNKEQDPDNDSFKDGAAIAQVANKVIHIARDNTETEEWIEQNWWWRTIRYIVTKNRWKSWLWVIMWTFKDWRILMTESKLSKERREQKKLWWE